MALYLQVSLENEIISLFLGALPKFQKSVLHEWYSWNWRNLLKAELRLQKRWSYQNKIAPHSPPSPSVARPRWGEGECHTPSQDPLPLIIPHFTRDCKLQGKSYEITKVNWISKTVPIMTWYRFCRTVSRLFFLQKMDFDLSAVQSVSLKSILRYRIILGSFLSASRTTNIWKQTEIREMYKGGTFLKKLWCCVAGGHFKIILFINWVHIINWPP